MQMPFFTRFRFFSPFSPSATSLQSATYLLGVSLFSISFLVFLNSTTSFVITDRLGQRNGVGNVVGTLGFVDELVALIACPVWGMISDRVGVSNVTVAGYLIISLALALFVAATNVYPQLLLARIVFAIGASATVTMVTAILPSLTDEHPMSDPSDENSNNSTTLDSRTQSESRFTNQNSIAYIRASNAAVAPEIFGQNRSQQRSDAHVNCPQNSNSLNHSKPATMAGYVGLFTGCGALLALVLFLPLPAKFSNIDSITMAKAVEYSYDVVAAAAVLVAIFVSLGLRGLRGEKGKGWGNILRWSDPRRFRSDTAPLKPIISYRRLLASSVYLGFKDSRIGLSYFGGFVARASTVAISLFVPLAVNNFYMRNGFCQGSSSDLSPDIRKECKQAYILASILTGVAQLVGLICAPVFGFLNSRMSGNTFSWPIIAATVLGVVGHATFAQLQSPEIKDQDGRGGGPAVLAIMSMIGVSQIGAIVSSLGSLGHAILDIEANPNSLSGINENEASLVGQDEGAHETSLLFPSGANESAEIRSQWTEEIEEPRVRLKGSIAGVYSLCGGAAILLLTKLGGYLFDQVSTGAPFYMMALFNGALLIVTVAMDIKLVINGGKIVIRTQTA